MKPGSAASSSRSTAAATRLAAAASAPGQRITSSRSARAPASSFGPLPWRVQPALASAASELRSSARAPRSAAVSTRARQSPSSGCWGRARTTSTPAPAPRSQPELAGAGHDVLAVGDAAGEQVLQEVAHRGLAGPLGRLGPVDLERDQVAHEPQQRRRRRLAAGAVAQLAHRQLGHPQLHASPSRPRPPSPRARPRSTRQATASTLLAASSTITLASSARPAARATAGSPAPDSTASETSSRASRKVRGSAAAGVGAAVSVRGLRPSGVLVVGPDDREAHRHPHPEHRGEDEERQEARRDLLPDAAVAAPRGRRISATQQATTTPAASAMAISVEEKSKFIARRARRRAAPAAARARRSLWRMCSTIMRDCRQRAEDADAQAPARRPRPTSSAHAGRCATAPMAAASTIATVMSAGAGDQRRACA